MHSLVWCSFAASCWDKLSILSVSGDYYSFADWLHLVFQQRRREEIRIIAIVCWMLWKSRNDLVWNRHSLDSSKVVWKSAQDNTFDCFMGYMTHEDKNEHRQLLVVIMLKLIVTQPFLKI